MVREIVPVKIPGRQGETVVDVDEHPRPVTPESLARLKPLFSGGSITAGNASGVTDGAVALLVASEAAVELYGLTPMARVVSAVSVGVPPRTMGMGPEPTRSEERRVGKE